MQNNQRGPVEQHRTHQQGTPASQRTQRESGLVVLYDIQPGNGTGLFFQPQSPCGVSE